MCGPTLRIMSIDRPGLVVGGIRLASGLSFLVDPDRANRLRGDPEKPTGSTWLLLHSMGYRDALIGGLLAAAALRGRDTRGWFVASGGARRRGVACQRSGAQCQATIGAAGSAAAIIRP